MEPLTGCGPAAMCLIFCTGPHALPCIGRYDHIYMFDRVFSRVTLKALAARLQAFPRAIPSGPLNHSFQPRQACDFRVLVSSRHWREWWGLGLPKVQPVAKIRMATTGKEKARSCNWGR